MGEDSCENDWSACPQQPQPRANHIEPLEHFVQFYDADHTALGEESGPLYLVEGLTREAKRFWSSRPRNTQKAIARQLRALGCDPKAPAYQDRCAFRDAAAMLAKVYA